MDTLKLLEEEWRSLGQREVELAKEIADDQSRAKLLRVTGDGKMADAFFDAAEKKRVELESVKARVREVEPKYFALVRRKLRERQR